MLKIFSSLKLVRGVLYRETQVDSQKKNLLVLPSCFIEQVLTGLHNDITIEHYHFYVIDFIGQE